jgi:hypothetical protein
VLLGEGEMILYYLEEGLEGLSFSAVFEDFGLGSCKKLWICLNGGKGEGGIITGLWDRQNLIST